jgi:two-component system response regulator CpxR
VSTLLLIDDDLELCELLTSFLASEGVALRAVHDGEAGLREALSGANDLVILDVMLPDLSGFDVLRRIRDASSIPVVMLTARGEEVDKVVGLEMGADDYLAKPFLPRELMARIRAVLRRTGPGGRGHADEPRVLAVGDVELDAGALRVTRSGHPVTLTSVEFVLLRTLMANAGNVVSREVLTRVALGRDVLPFDRSLDVHVSNLRRKLGKGGKAPSRIRSVRSRGYLYALPEGARA